MTSLLRDTQTVTARPASERVLGSLPHIAGLVLVIAAAIAVGRPIGWIGVGAALGPAAVIGVARLAGRSPSADDLEGLVFGVVIAFMTAGSWVLTQAPTIHQAFIAAYPVALLVFMFGAVNFVLVACSRTYRSWRGQELDYPWLPGSTRERLATLREDSHGNG